MAEAAAGGRPFVVVTTAPAPAASIGEMAKAYDYGDLCRGVCLTCGEAHEVMADSHRLEAGLAAACKQAVRHHDAEAIVIGGGPLAMAARALKARFTIPIIEPLPAAVRLAITCARDLDQSGMA